VSDDANKFINSARGQWESLVQIAVTTPANRRKETAVVLANASFVGKSNLERKLEAIHLALAAGVSVSEVIDRGQRWTIAKFVTDKRNGREDKQVVLKWLVSPQIREDAQALFNRFGELLNLRTPDERWSYILGVFADATDLELLHQSGDGDRAKKPR
jgi:hypothetical protein